MTALLFQKTGGTFNLDFGTEFNDASKVKFWVWFGPNVALENSFLINGSPVTSMTTFDALHFFEVDLPSGLQTIQWSGPNVPTNNTQTILSAIFVDDVLLVDSGVVSRDVKVISTGYPDSNTMVVDGGDWLADAEVAGQNRDEIWSSTITNNDPSFPGSRGFNGDFDSACLNRAGNNVKWDARSYGLSGVVRVAYNTLDVSDIGDGYINGSVINNGAPINCTKEEAINSSVSWYNLGNIGLGQVEFGGEATYKGFYAIEVDGKILVDRGVGESHVEYQTKGGQGDIIEVNTDDNTIVLSDTGDRDNRWIKGFSVAGPSIIDEPLLTNDVQLRVSDFATTPPGADTLKEIIWSINGTEYSANTTNPWSPLEKLPINSTVTVKVKYKGNTLEDSDWSPDVTFTTGTSMRSLFTRIAALEANDVTDDATDTALLTLIAGLAARIQALEESN